MNLPPPHAQDSGIALEPRVRELLRHARQTLVHHRELEQTTGERFNLFHILGIDHYEVSTHSPLLAELLNPEGCHGQGALFLKCFLRSLELTENLDLDSARVRTEVSLGPRTETEGGRLDILVEDKARRQIAIENKIHGAEQPKWVERYRNGLQKDACLIYLTLDGRKPTQYGEASADAVTCISYGGKVLDWLKACRKEAATIPVVRESLTQYIRLIQNLTSQNTSNRMNDELVKLVLDRDMFPAFCALRNSDPRIRGSIVLKLNECFPENRVSKDIAFSQMPEGNCQAGEAYVLCTPELINLKLKIALEFEGYGYTKCFFGFKALDPDNHPPNPLLQELFREKFGACRSTTYWPAWQWWKHQSWDDAMLTTILSHKEQVAEELRVLMTDLHEVYVRYCKQLTAVNTQG